MLQLATWERAPMSWSTSKSEAEMESLLLKAAPGMALGGGGGGCAGLLSNEATPAGLGASAVLGAAAA